MTTSQPLVCASLHLPPDTQPFQRIYEISWHVFAPNLDRLRLAVDGFRNINPEAVKIFNETRIVLHEELMNVYQVLLAAKDLARRYLVLLEAVKENNPTHDPVYRVGIGAEMGMRCSNEAEQAFFAFRKELEKAIGRITTVTDTKHRKGSKSLLTSSQNVQLVSEIYSAINECNGLLQQCHVHFAQLLERTRNEYSVDTDPPSEEETQVMCAKWQTFFDTIGELKVHAYKIADGILYESSDTHKNTSGSPKRQHNVLLWRVIFQRKDKQDLVRSQDGLEAPRQLTDPGVATRTLGSSQETSTNEVNLVDATQLQQVPEGRPITDSAPSNIRTRSKVTVLFRRRVLRRINSSTSTSPRDVPEIPERPDTSDNTHVTTAPVSKVSLWRKIFRWAGCGSSTPS